MSHPAKGVWIEIQNQTAMDEWIECHTLQRVCGLKSISMIDNPPSFTSHPAKGVWIEISDCFCASVCTLSHPAKGVWIEIKTFVALPERQKVTPCKGWIEIY